MKHILTFLIVLGALFNASVRESGAEFIGDFPTGLLELENKYSYFLYVPPDYSPEKSWPLIFLLGKRGEDPKEVITPWVEWAKKNQFIVLTPPNKSPEKDVPLSVDQWLFELKKEVGERYRIDPAQTLLVGFEAGAHYAAYLGTRYPEEFSAVALFREAWPGSFEKLIKPSTNPQKQISFYVSMDPKAEGFSVVEAKALEFEKKGYRVAFDPLKSGEDLATLRDRMIQWFREDREARSVLKEKPRVKFKDKFRGFLDDFFEV